MLPHVPFGESVRQVEPNTTERLHYPCTNFEQAQAQRVYLGLCPPRSFQRFLEHAGQDACCAMQQQPELICEKSMTTRTATNQIQLEFFDPVLHVSTLGVSDIGLLRRCFPIARHFKACVYTISSRLRFDHNPARLRPGSALVEQLAILPASVTFQS